MLFDLDNTLYAYDPAHKAGMLAVYEKALRKIGIAPDEFKKAFDAARSEIKKQLGKTASSHSRLLYFQRTLEHLEFRSQILLSLELEQTYWGNYLASSEVNPGVFEFLDQLARANIPRVLVTDLTSQIQFRKLVYMDLDQRFEYVVTSEESGNDKPDPAGFDIALSKLGSSLPEEPTIWMIGDNVKSDIEGAKNGVNASTIALKSALGEEGNNPSIDMTFDEFDDLEKFVADKGWE